MDDQYQLLAGAHWMPSGRASAQDIGIDSDRSYVSYQEMAEAESRREDGIEAVSIVTPNDSNAAVTGNRLPAGHPEGYYEAFATVYSEIARAIRALQCGDELPSGLPDLDSGLDAVEFVEAAVNSHRAGNVWTPKHRTR